MNQDIRTLIDRYELQYDLPNGLLYGLVIRESGGNPRAESSLGAKGLTQIIQKYHPSVNDPFDPDENLAYAARTLAKYRESLGSWERAVAAWHSGPNAVLNNLREGGDGIPSTRDRVTKLSTRDYVNKIMRYVTGNSPTSGLTPGTPQPGMIWNRELLGIIGMGIVIVGGLILTKKT